VEYFNILLNVPSETTHIATDSDGAIFAYTCNEDDEPELCSPGPGVPMSHFYYAYNSPVHVADADIQSNCGEAFKQSCIKL
jgi:hypothetical protein